MNNIPIPILGAVIGAAAGMLIVFEELRVIIILAAIGFAIGKALELPQVREKIKELLSFE